MRATNLESCVVIHAAAVNVYSVTKMRASDHLLASTHNARFLDE